MDEATAYKWASQVLRDSAGMGIQLHHGQTLADRIASALVEATREPPPVVPVGWMVAKTDGCWRLLCKHWARGEPPLEALRAKDWANKHDTRPPHAGDGEVESG